MRNIISFIGGLIIGAVASYCLTKNNIKASCEKECQKEIDDYKKFVKEKVLAGGTMETHREAVKKLREAREKYSEKSDKDLEKKNDKNKIVEEPLSDLELNILKMYDYNNEDDTMPTEISYAEKETLVEDYDYEDIFVRYNVVDDELTNASGEIVTSWDGINEELVKEHNAGEEIYIANLSIQTVFTVQIVGDLYDV